MLVMNFVKKKWNQAIPHYKSDFATLTICFFNTGS